MKDEVQSVKRISMISPGLSGGGAERVLAILANYLAKEGYEVLFIAVYSSEKQYFLDERVIYKYVDIKKACKGIRLLKRMVQIEKMVCEFKSDIIISFLMNEVLLTNVKNKIPIIYSMRNDPSNTLKKIYERWICFFSYRRAQNIVFQTKGARDYFPHDIAQKGIVITNPLLDDLPYWDINGHKKIIMTACRLTKQKNIKMLLNAFSLFHTKFPDYILEIYGRGELLKELKVLCTELEIEQCTFFKGHVDTVHDAMVKSEMFVLSSDYEGLSNAMLEALAIGVPTICTDCPPGGAAEYIQSGVNGLLVPVGDVQMLYQCMCRMAGNDDEKRRMSEEAVKVRDKLCINEIIKEWENLF